jgi:hypothetical protein
LSSFHIDQFHFPLFRAIAGRTVTTLHGRQDLPDLLPLYVGATRRHGWMRRSGLL